ncbi:MAG TPA: hypothetical protein VGM60_03180 [Pseudonocardia sp.]|jgi:hypothetical protein
MRAEELDPRLPAALDKLVDPDTRGDPMTPIAASRVGCGYLEQVLLGAADAFEPGDHDLVAGAELAEHRVQRGAGGEFAGGLVDHEPTAAPTPHA